MAGRGIREGNFWGRLFLLMVVCYALSGCSRAETVQEDSTVYVYVPNLMVTSASGGYGLPEGFERPVMIENFLYFKHWDKTGDFVKRAIFSAADRTVGLGEADTVFRVSTAAFALENEEGQISAEERMMAMLDRAMGEEPGGGTSGADEEKTYGGADVDAEKTYCRFSLQDYAADREQNVYLLLAYYEGGYYTMEHMGSILCRQTPGGELAYCRYLPGVKPAGKSFAADGTGGVYLLAEDEILLVDGTGRTAARIGTGDYKGGAFSSERIVGNPDGNIYYFVYENHDSIWKGMEIDRRGGRMQEVPGLSGTDWMGTCSVFGEDLYYSDPLNAVLYGYDRELGEARNILLWGNSNLIDSCVQDFIVLGQEEILVLYEETGMTGLYLLEKTPAYGLPEKKTVVLAAFGTTLEMENAIIRFNRQSSEYQVILEDYGYSGGNAEGAQVRMDAALVSASPPELLSLKDRDLEKDMEKGLLEDLFPYLEESKVLDREDFLENALEGYTVNGKLVGIPKEVYVYGVAGRVSQVGDLKSWTMEDVYALTEKYPKMQLLSSGSTRDINTREHLLEDFCSPYYLEEFVDWENGECSFDSDGFRRLLVWAGEYGKASDESVLPGMRIISEACYVPEDTLLIEDNLSFGQAAVWEVQLGESIRLLGYPTADGKGSVRLDAKAPAGIVAGAKNKDGAWAFLEYFLEAETSGGVGLWVSVRKSDLENRMEDSIRKENDRIKFSVGLDGEAVPVYGNSRETAQQVMASLKEADFSPDNSLEDRIIGIVVEESEGYYTGNKSLDEVTGIIQNRVRVLLGENR